VRYQYRLPDTLDELVAATGPDVQRLSGLAIAMAIYRAVRDWPGLLGDDDIMEAAKEACKLLLLTLDLLEREGEEKIAATNSLEAFSLLFCQNYYGAYQGIKQTSREEIQAMVQWLRHRTEADAITLLTQTMSNRGRP
jgi:hypothetical protein